MAINTWLELCILYIYPKIMSILHFALKAANPNATNPDIFGQRWRQITNVSIIIHIISQISNPFSRITLWRRQMQTRQTPTPLARLGDKQMWVKLCISFTRPFFRITLWRRQIHERRTRQLWPEMAISEYASNNFALKAANPMPRTSTSLARDGNK